MISVMENENWTVKAMEKGLFNISGNHVFEMHSGPHQTFSLHNQYLFPQ